MRAAFTVIGPGAMRGAAPILRQVNRTRAHMCGGGLAASVDPTRLHVRKQEKCVRARARACEHVRLFMRVCVGVCARCACACVRVRVGARARACVHVCVRACVRVCACARDDTRGMRAGAKHSVNRLCA
jgi:hypothetical protein